MIGLDRSADEEAGERDDREAEALSKVLVYESLRQLVRYSLRCLK